MTDITEKPLIVNADRTVLLETSHPLAEEAAGRLEAFAELVKSPDRFCTYRITALSLWQAAADGLDAERIIDFLRSGARYGVPAAVREYVRGVMNRCGALRLERSDDGERLNLVARDEKVLEDILNIPAVRAFCVSAGGTGLAVEPARRGEIKRELTRAGYPVVDLAGFRPGETLPLSLREPDGNGGGVVLRDYQREAVGRFFRDEDKGGGSGVIVLPCGAGKTVVGIAVLCRLQCAALILTTNATSVSQWKRELLARTNARPEWIGEYTGRSKEVRPITIATYHILARRGKKTDEPGHMRLFHERDWGLVIYDEVHLLPAPVFRMTAEIQAARRLGLTATLVREDGREGDVFSLIGPKRYELRWRHLERGGFIAAAECVEILVPLSAEGRERYARAGKKEKHRIAGENPEKLEIAELILQKHRNGSVIVIGQFLDQLREASLRLGAPMICGDTPQEEREMWYGRFRRGDIRVLVVSKVANFAVDLPSANVAVQLSGSFGSRQEEAQRLGRILRAKEGDNRAFFYSLVTPDSCEMEFAHHRRLFLLEQGYAYRQIAGRKILETEPVTG